MSNLKTIKVNPIFLGTNNSGQPKNKTRKEKPVLSSTLGSTNNVKKKLIARIKNFQQTTTHNNTNNNINNNTNNIQDDEFNASVNFLNDLSRDKVEKKHFKHNTTLKKKQPVDKEAYMQIATELPPELNWNTFKIQPATSMPIEMPAPAIKMSFPMQPPPPQQQQQIAMQPPPQQQQQQIAMQPPVVVWQPPPAPSYGNLKNGKKPTFRTWQRTTQKNRVALTSQPVINILDDIVIDPMPIKENTGEEEKKVIVEDNEPLQVPMPMPIMPMPIMPEPVPVPVPVAKPRRKRITRTLKYKLGKHTNGKVSVLIKNAQTRRKVQTETALLKQKSILDVKNYLRSNNLLKVGSEAPNDVLRQMYEQSILAGAIENKANDVLLHNYFNDEKK
jgi:hypothetical protein